MLAFAFLYTSITFEEKTTKMRHFLLLILSISFLITACGGSENEENSNTTIQNNELDEVEIIPCDELTVEDFDEFLGIKYGSKELNLESKVGKFTGGEYSADSAAFIYYYNRVERVPISVWVNAKTSKVETIFMEVLSYSDENFEKDLKNAVDEFNISTCDASWFGMKESAIVKRLGEPSVEESLKDNVRSISYDSQDFIYAVNFKFYPDQQNKCSSISLNWFY